MLQSDIFSPPFLSVKVMISALEHPDFFLDMFQSCPSGGGTVDKIKSVSSSIPSDSSINRATASPECVPLSLTYIRWSTPNWSALLGLRCWFKMSTDSVSVSSLYVPVSSKSHSSPPVCFMYATTVSGLLLFLPNSVCHFPPFVSSHFKSSICFQATEILCIQFAKNAAFE